MVGVQKPCLCLVLIASFLIVQCLAQSDRPFPPEWELRKWQNGIVKYVFDNNTLDSPTINLLQTSFKEIEDRTCVRFQLRQNGDQAYTELKGTDGCGHSGGCGMDGKQTTTFGNGCRSTSVMVHEFMHVLCYPHYQERSDRDIWLNYDECHDPDKQPPKPDPNWPVGESLYDYTSKVSDGCCQCTHGGRPTMSGIECNQCGGDISPTLSVMDADMINELYDCQGCYRHRWRKIENADRIPARNMVPFGKLPNGQDVQICRGYVNGEVVIGKYWTGSKTCYLSYGGQEHALTEHAQIFTVQDGQLEMPGATYKLVDRRNVGNPGQGNIIPSCRKVTGLAGYVAVASFGEQISIGKVWKDQMDKAMFPVDGLEAETDNFQVLTCV